MNDDIVNDPCECGQTTIRGCADMPSRHCGACGQTEQPATDINALIDEMRAGLEGVTPGPWVALRSDPAEGVNCHWIKAQPSPALRGFSKEVACVSGTYYADGPDVCDAAHIARCSPANIAALLDEIERLRAYNARLREALAQSRDWFQQYADGHAAKGDTDKAKRNQDRADFCAREAMDASNGK